MYLPILNCSKWCCPGKAGLSVTGALCLPCCMAVRCPALHALTQLCDSCVWCVAAMNGPFKSNFCMEGRQGAGGWVGGPMPGAVFILRRICLQSLHDLLCQQQIGTHVTAGVSGITTAGKEPMAIHRLEEYDGFYQVNTLDFPPDETGTWLLICITATLVLTYHEAFTAAGSATWHPSSITVHELTPCGACSSSLPSAPVWALFSFTCWWSTCSLSVLCVLLLLLSVC